MTHDVSSLLRSLMRGIDEPDRARLAEAINNAPEETGARVLPAAKQRRLAASGRRAPRDMADVTAGGEDVYSEDD